MLLLKCKHNKWSNTRSLLLVPRNIFTKAFSENAYLEMKFIMNWRTKSCGHSFSYQHLSEKELPEKSASSSWEGFHSSQGLPGCSCPLSTRDSTWHCAVTCSLILYQLCKMKKRSSNTKRVCKSLLRHLSISIPLNSLGKDTLSEPSILRSTQLKMQSLS